MAHHKSAAKKARRDAAMRLRNRSNRSAMKTAIKRLLGAVSAGDKAAASALLPKTIGIVDRSCRKGVLHKGQFRDTADKNSSQEDKGNAGKNKPQRCRDAP